MKKLPFTCKGFQDLQDQLYLQSDDALMQEAKKIQDDFTSWMDEHFELRQTQLLYLISIDKRVLMLIAFETSFAIANRLPIRLNKGEAFNDEQQGKIIWPKSTIVAFSGDKGQYFAKGALEINIEYENVYVLSSLESN